MQVRRPSIEHLSFSVSNLWDRTRECFDTDMAQREGDAAGSLAGISHEQHLPECSTPAARSLLSEAAPPGFDHEMLAVRLRHSTFARSRRKSRQVVRVRRCAIELPNQFRILAVPVRVCVRVCAM